MSEQAILISVLNATRVTRNKLRTVPIVRNMLPRVVLVVAVDPHAVGGNAVHLL